MTQHHTFRSGPSRRCGQSCGERRLPKFFNRRDSTRKVGLGMFLCGLSQQLDAFLDCACRGTWTDCPSRRSLPGPMLGPMPFLCHSAGCARPACPKTGGAVTLQLSLMGSQPGIFDHSDSVILRGVGAATTISVAKARPAL